MPGSIAAWVDGYCPSPNPLYPNRNTISASGAVQGSCTTGSMNASAYLIYGPDSGGGWPNNQALNTDNSKWGAEAIRNLYLPGQTVHWSLIRDSCGWQQPD